MSLIRMRPLFFGILVSCVFAGGLCHEYRAPPLIKDLLATTRGQFVQFSDSPKKIFGVSGEVRRWVSSSGDDSTVGTIQLGPFLAPHILHFWAAGYPKHDANELYIENANTHERRPIDAKSDVGTQWQLIGLGIPEQWVGTPLLLIARGSGGQSGWIGLSEPVVGGANEQLLSALTGFSVNGLLLGLLWFAALRRLSIDPPLPECWLPLIAAAAVSALGYLAFWAYLANPALGKVYSCAIISLACVDLLWNCEAHARGSSDAISAAVVLMLVGYFYVSLLYLFPSNFDFYDLANGRWRALAGDNYLPHEVARDLFHGWGLHWPKNGWLASDRPPLQSGWLLITWFVDSSLGLDEYAAGGTSAIWLQLIWVFAGYGLMRTLKLSAASACGWIAALSLCGFFIVNSAFTWPKLSAGAFGCGVFGLWMAPNLGPSNYRRIAIGAALAALAMLSHGGVAFSFIALAPWIACKMGLQWRRWGVAILVFLVVVGPWIAFQKFYAPPGNRLIKWHLAGQIDIDPRGTWQTLKDSYSKSSWDQLVSARVSNFRIQSPGSWGWLPDFSTVHAPDRRHHEFFNLARSLTWWLFGVAALPFALVRMRRRPDWRTHIDLLLWAIATLVVWCIMLFLPNSAVIHQGSYTLPIVLFALLSVWLELASKWSILVVLPLQMASFLTTYAVAGDEVGGQISRTAATLALSAGILLFVFAASQFGPRFRTNALASRESGR
jgi:hypothetical protein